MDDCPYDYKLAYESMAKAKRAAASFRRKTGEYVTAYECPASIQHWHVGHEAFTNPLR